MQVFHTAGVPPNEGSNNLPNNGCTTNINVALTNRVPAKRKIRAGLRPAEEVAVVFIYYSYFRTKMLSYDNAFTA